MRHWVSGFTVLASLTLTLFGGTTTTHAQPCDPNEKLKLFASDGENTDVFGTAVALNSTTTIIGAWADDDNGGASGAAYLFNTSSGEQLAKLLPHDGAALDHFGYAVAISDDTALIGARSDDDNGMDSGSVYVFQYDGKEWIEVAKLLATDGEAEDTFGSSIALKGNTAVIGAPSTDASGNAHGIGSAYVYRFNGVEWVEEATLHASDGHAADGFGLAVTFSSDSVVIGAPYQEEYGVSSGAAYVFHYDGDEWSEQVKLRRSDGEEYDYFGTSVAISDNNIVVGASGDDDYEVAAGSTYIFFFDGTRWQQHSKIYAADATKYDFFGTSVAIADNTILVGALRNDGGTRESGSAYVFRAIGSRWLQQAKLFATDVRHQEGFGTALAFVGDVAIVGARSAEGVGSRTGAAYVFELSCRECLNLQIYNLVAKGNGEFLVSGGMPGAKCITVVGRNEGNSLIKGTGGYCATFGINGITKNRVIGGLNQRFDINGEIAFSIKIPRFADGVTLFFQSAQHGTCPSECISNVVKAVVH